MDHTDSINENKNNTSALIGKGNRAVRKVQKNGMEAATQFEGLKALSKGQREESANTGNQKPLYAEKTASHD